MIACRTQFAVVFSIALLTPAVAAANNQFEELVKSLEGKHSYKLPTSEVKLFDSIVMGLSTEEDINLVADPILVPKSTNQSLCTNNKRCDLKNIEPIGYGNVGPKFYSNDDAKWTPLPITFSQFTIGRKKFIGTFYEGRVVQLTFERDNMVHEVDADMAAELRASFDRKYKKAKQTVSKVVTHYKRTTTTVSKWIEPSGAFEVNIEEQRKVNLPGKEAECLQNAMGLVGPGAATIQFDCMKASDNIPKYTLSYVYASGLNKALSDLSAQDAGESETKKRATAVKRISSF